MEIVCGLPFCAPEKEQTNCSIGLRAASAILSSVVATIGVLALCHIQGLASLGVTGGSSMIASGVFVCLVAAAIKCVKKGEEPTQEVPLVPVKPDITPTQLAASRKTLDEGIEIPDEVQTKLEALSAAWSTGQDNFEITWYKKGGGVTDVFSLTSMPHLIFKLGTKCLVGNKGPDQRIRERFEKTVKANAIREAYQLDRLVIPATRLIEVSGHQIIVEQRLDFEPHQLVQEKLYHDLAEELDEVLVQLTTFIALTRFDDVESRNIPIMAGESRQVALIDLDDTFDETLRADTGIIGGYPKRTGLINYLYSERQIDLVLNKACELKVITPQKAQEAKALRMKQLNNNQALHRFYEERGILRADDLPIYVKDWESLGLDLDATAKVAGSCIEKERMVTKKEAAQEIIEAINAKIFNSQRGSLLQRKRYMNSNELYIFNSFRYLGLPDNFLGSMTAEEVKQNRWTNHILNALVDKGYLFSVSCVDGTYFIQA